MLSKTRAISLHTIKYSDSSIIAHTYTEKFGRQAYIIKGAYNKKAPVKANLFAPLHLLEMEVYHKESSELQKVKEAVNIEVFHSIHSDNYKNTISIFIAELLYRVLREETPNQNLFDFLYNSIKILDLENIKVADFHLVFMIQLAKYIGFFPEDNFSDIYPFFDLIDGKFVSEAPSNPYFIPKFEASVFSSLIKCNYSNVANIQVDHQTRVVLLDKLSAYYHLHFPEMGKIKSLSVLSEVFR